MTIYYALHNSPTGELLLMSDGRALTDLHMTTGKYVPEARKDWVRDDALPVFALARKELDAYFAGTLRTFTVPLAPKGTDFQKRVWTALTKIPFGETRTYGQQAVMIGQPAAVRAVGAVNGKNPIGIIVPGHRVIGANGTLTG